MCVCVEEDEETIDFKRTQNNYVLKYVIGKKYLRKVDSEGKRVRTLGTPCYFILISTYRFSGSGCTTSGPL